jgi:hypothetical protein
MHVLAPIGMLYAWTYERQLRMPFARGRGRRSLRNRWRMLPLLQWHA